MLQIIANTVLLKEASEMLVDKNKLAQAKEKIGDRTPFLIAEILNLQEFDDHALKSLCPFHQEDTPSFIYNPKTYSYHCFGCGKNVSIIDAYIESGKTFLEAAQAAFEEAGMKYGFGEKGVQTQRNYRYPVEVPKQPRSKVDSYFAARKISKETLDYCDVREDEYGNAVFNYYDLNDVLTMVKYRPSRKIDKSKGDVKNWCQKGADTKPLLFNMNRINTEQPLLITEGESDCLAAIESGYTNSVSVPLGSQNHHWIEVNWEWLDQFSEIIICADNDEAGMKMVADVCPRIGSWRTKVVSIPYHAVNVATGKERDIKDLNELLYCQGKQAVLDVIMNAADSPIESVSDLSDVDDINIADIDGIYFGIEDLDKELFKMFFGTLTLVTGKPGSGKTSFLYQVICNALEQGRGAWIFSRELPSYMSKSWLNYLMAGPRNVEQCVGKHNATYYRVTQSAKRKINECYKGQWFIYKDEWANDIESIQHSMEDSARKYGSKLFLIDNLMTVNLHATDDNRYDKQTEFINWLIQFSSQFNVCVILVAHPRKLQNSSGPVDLYDIGGSSNIVNLAHRTIALRRVTKEEKETGARFSQFSCVASVTKDRMRGRSGFELGMYYDDASRRFFTSYDEYDRKYRWDDRIYRSRLSCEVLDAENEIYGGHLPA